MSTETAKPTKAELDAKLAAERQAAADAAKAAEDAANANPDAPLVEDDAPELQAEPPAAAPAPVERELTQQEVDEAYAAEMERHGLAMLELFGPDAGSFEICPICSGSGFALKDRDKPPALVQHPRTRMCEDCNGRGQMSTGSKMQGQTEVNCPTCNGAGYTYPTELAGVPLGPSQTPPSAPPALSVVPPAGTPDAWGRPPGHPHYGMNPALVGV